VIGENEGAMAASNALAQVVLPAVIGALVGAGVVEYRHRPDVGAATVSTERGTEEVKTKGDLVTLSAEVARLKANAPSQSHAMSDVGYQWTNVWFAGEKKNWPLARFYFEETRQHILWTIRLRPVRKGPDGNDVNLVPIFEGIDTSAFKAMADAIQGQDAPAFAAAYRMTLEACYGCHKASGKPYLRPMIPTAPAQTIVNFDPAATWPQ
jgi:cytochrome c553